METHHRVIIGDSRSMDEVADGSVELVVTSPPYPMIEMWDEVFGSLEPAVRDQLDAADGPAAFEAMHGVLDATWDELERVVTPGGIVCVVVGDATRSVDGSFRVYPNHARIARALVSLGFEPLPEILWRKPVNSTTKFMGSGMLPPNAYVTLEHEFVLIFRKGSTPRSFEPSDPRRYESAYFWEERNEWFSDVWTDIGGVRQELFDADLRDRSAAYPLEVPYRLINMYSVYGDTVLDPFWGIGTTTTAAMVATRNSIGYELDGGFLDRFDAHVDTLPSLSREIIEDRLTGHRRFVDGRDGAGLSHHARQYDVPVMTSQETELVLYAIDMLERDSTGYRVEHTPYVHDDT